MKFIKYIIFLLLVGLPVRAEDGKETVQPRVIVYSYPTGRFEGIINWSCPAFAAYWDGRIIWRKGWENSVAALFQTKNKAADVIVKKIESVVTEYSGKTFTLTASSDPIETELWTNGKRLRILGDWQKPVMLKAYSQEQEDVIAQTNDDERKLWLSLPNEIRQLLISLVEYDSPDKIKWRPEKIIVSLQAPIKTTELTIAWPDGWPRKFISESNSIYGKGTVISGAMLDIILEKFPDDGRPRAISLDGEVRFPSIRLIFPGVLEASLESGL